MRWLGVRHERGAHAGDGDRREGGRHAQHGQDATGSAAAQAGAGHRLRPLAKMDVRAHRPPSWRRIHHEPADVRPDGHRGQPAFGQAVVHSQHRRCRQRPAQPVESARQRVGVRARRRRPPPAPQAADSAVPRQEHQELRKDLRRGDPARIGGLAGGSGIPDARADDAHHAQCHPSRGVRRRR